MPHILRALLIIIASCDVCAENYELIDEAPFNSTIFTQGFAYVDQRYLISSGLYGRSFIEIQALDGTTIRRRKLADTMFAEGLTVVGGDLYLLTWKRGLAFKLDRKTLDLKNTYRYSGQGWGLAYDGKTLLMSDGSAQITIRNPDDFKAISHFVVTENEKAITMLNELEYAEGALWANIWQSDDIVKIDPNSGQVLARFHLAALRRQAGTRNRDSVLNGIAYDTVRQAFWVTGKNWSRRYLVRFKQTNTVESTSHKTLVESDGKSGAH